MKAHCYHRRTIEINEREEERKKIINRLHTSEQSNMKRKQKLATLNGMLLATLTQIP